jgi:hypothetical protein
VLTQDALGCVQDVAAVLRLASGATLCSALDPVYRVLGLVW